MCADFHKNLRRNGQQRVKYYRNAGNHGANNMLKYGRRDFELDGARFFC